MALTVNVFKVDWWRSLSTCSRWIGGAHCQHVQDGLVALTVNMFKVDWWRSLSTCSRWIGGAMKESAFIELMHTAI